MLFGRVGFFVFGSAVCGALSGVSAQEMAVIPQVDVSGYQQDASTSQLLEGKSAKVFTGNIPQVTEFGGNTISLRGLEESYATLIVPVMPELVSDVPNSPVAGQGLIIGTGNTVLYEAEGTGNGFGFIQYGYGNALSGRAYGHNNNALVAQFGNNNRALFNQFGDGNSLSIMQGQ
jgi:hypothetical protein